MKNLFVAALLAAAAAAGFAAQESAPKFENERAFIIDAAAIRGKLKDNVKLVNQTSDENLFFAVYGFCSADDDRQFIGISFLKGAADSDTLTTPFENNLKQFRYFAVAAKNEKTYNYHAEKRNNDLYIYIR